MKHITIILLALFLFGTNCKKDKEDNTLTDLLLLNFLLGNTDTGTAVVTTLAGSLSESGYIDGSGTSARFNGLNDITIDSSGNLYVIDGSKNGSNTYRVRRISSSGEVSTLAGNGTNTATNGTGTAAGFFQPIGIAIDSANNLYISASTGSTIRRITPAAVATTPAAGDGAGFLNGGSAAYRLNSPQDLITDSSDNLIITDTNNHAIRRMTTTGFDVTTIAGAAPTTPISGSSDGTGNAARFNRPTKIAIDDSGNLYVGDADNYSIRKITPSAVVTTLAGSGIQGYTNGVGRSAQLGVISALVADKNGNIYFSENSSIRKISPDGTVSIVAGRNNSRGSGEGSTSQNGTGTGARFRQIRGLAIDNSGNLYAADGDSIRKIVP
jgi:sugar lactone lactonase YvrE